MKSVLKFFARLYPASWRIRYGSEFDALLDHVRPTPRAFLDVLLTAGAMRIMTWSFCLQAVTLVTLGALATLSLAFFLVPAHYISDAVITVQAPDPLSAVKNNTLQSLSPGPLLSTIHKFNLYPAERSRMPVDDALRKMRSAVVLRAVTGLNGFTLSFDYPDAAVAQKVCADLVSRMIETNLTQSGGALMQVIQPATLPQRPLYPKRPLIASEGAAAGLILAFLWQFALRTRT